MTINRRENNLFCAVLYILYKRANTLRNRLKFSFIIAQLKEKENAKKFTQVLKKIAKGNNLSLYVCMIWQVTLCLRVATLYNLMRSEMNGIPITDVTSTTMKVTLIGIPFLSLLDVDSCMI